MTSRIEDVTRIGDTIPIEQFETADDRFRGPAGRAGARRLDRLHEVRRLGARPSPIRKRNSSASIPATASRTKTSSSTGVKKRYREKLHMYVAQARFLLTRPVAGMSLTWRALRRCRSWKRSTPRSSTACSRAADVAARPKEPQDRAQPEPAAALVRGQGDRDLHPFPATSWKAACRPASRSPTRSGRTTKHILRHTRIRQRAPGCALAGRNCRGGEFSRN